MGSPDGYHRPVDLRGSGDGSRRERFGRLLVAGLASGASVSDAGVALQVNLARGQQHAAEQTQAQARRLWRVVVDVAALHIRESGIGA